MSEWQIGSRVARKRAANSVAGSIIEIREELRGSDNLDSLMFVIKWDNGTIAYHSSCQLEVL